MSSHNRPKTSRLTGRAAAWTSALLALLTLAAEREARAIPPFARKYKTSCQTCHVIIPKLNSFGEAFRLNGFQIPNAEESLVKDEPVQLGAKPWRQMWPKAIWPSSLPGVPPLGLRIINDVQFTSDRNKSYSSNFEFPHEIEMLAGGRLTEQVGFFSETAWEQEESVSIEQAYLFFNGLLTFISGASEEALSARIGLFDPQFLFAYNERTRLGRVKPAWGDQAASQLKIGGLTSLNDFRLQDNQPGIELNGILARRFYWGAGIVTGNGQAAEDNNNSKDLYYKLKWKLFGRDFLGKMGEEDVSMESDTGNWLENKELLLEHFGYFGNGVAKGSHDDRFRYFGGAVRGTFQELDLSLGYVYGQHDRPFGSDSPATLETGSWFAKAEYMVFPWLMLRSVYEEAHFAAGVPPGVRPDSGHQRRVLLGPVIAPVANMAIEIEWEKHLDNRGMNGSDNLWIRLDVAF